MQNPSGKSSGLTDIRTRGLIRVLVVSSIASASLLLSACGGGKASKPGASLADAELAVAQAEQSRVGDYDAADLRAARDSLAQARATAGTEKDKGNLARWLAERAKIDAELGIARSEATRFRALTLAMQRDIDALKPKVVTPLPSPIVEPPAALPQPSAEPAPASAPVSAVEPAKEPGA